MLDLSIIQFKFLSRSKKFIPLTISLTHSHLLPSNPEISSAFGIQQLVQSKAGSDGPRDVGFFFFTFLFLSIFC